MSEAYPGVNADDAHRPARVHGAALRAAGWLRFGAAPIFAIMALQTDALGGGEADILCTASHSSPLGGMAAMYLLMSIFHAAPWLKLILDLRSECRHLR